MGQRKKRFVALVCAVSVIALSGCGDDLTQQVCIPGIKYYKPLKNDNS